MYYSEIVQTISEYCTWWSSLLWNYENKIGRRSRSKRDFNL